ncbi:MAG: SCO6880 family protein [Acidimicrobiales bacterium]
MELAEGHPELQAGQVRAQAAVDAGAEGRVAVANPPQVQLLGVFDRAAGALGEARAAYEEVLCGLRTRATAHHVLVCLQVAPAKGGLTEGMVELAAEVAALVRRLAGTGFSALPMSGADLAGCCRAIVSPPGPELSRLPVSPSGAGPMARRTTWGEVATDGVHHACYWVAQWPRVDLRPDWLAPLVLAPTGAIRTLSVVMEPLAPHVALRAAEAEVSAQTLDADARSRWGFASRARYARQYEAAIEREAELVAGHAGFRFAGLVGVTAPDPDALHRTCRELEAAGARSQVELRRLYGQQDEALAALAPLGRVRLAGRWA